MKYIEDFCNAVRKIEITEGVVDNGFTYEEGFEKLFRMISVAKEKHLGIFICGNGGSAGIAVHMTADLLKNGGLKTQSLYNPAVLTCLGNDLDYNHTFCKQLELMASDEDMLIAISSSGKSQNIINAINTMKELGGSVITFTGFKPDNPIRKMGNYNVYVPFAHYGIVESIHNMVLQQLVDEIVERDGIALKI